MMTVHEMNSHIQRLNIPETVGIKLRESILDRDQV